EPRQRTRGDEDHRAQPPDHGGYLHQGRLEDAQRPGHAQPRCQTLQRRRAAIHPDASRSENTTTPTIHSATISGSAGSSAVRTRAASRNATTAGPASAWAGVRTAASAPCHGDASCSDSAVPSGTATIKTSVAVASA